MAIDRNKFEAVSSNRGYLRIPYSIASIDRNTNSPYLWNGTCGVDKVRITIQTSNTEEEIQEAFFRMLGHYIRKGLVSFPDFPDLFISYLNTSNKAVQVNFNASDFTKPLGLNLCPFEAFSDVVKLVIDHVVIQSGELIRPLFFGSDSKVLHIDDYPKDWLKFVDLSELELARDFVIEDPRFNLWQMSRFRPKRAKAVTLHQNGGVLNTVTHPANSQSAIMKFYNKSNQMKSIDNSLYPENTYRYEVKLPRKKLKAEFIQNMFFATPRSLEMTLQDYWNRSNYYRPLIHQGSALHILFEEIGVYDGCFIFSYVEACLNGLAHYFTEEEHATNATYLKVLGLKKSFSLSSQGYAYGHLDFLSGTVEPI